MKYKNILWQIFFIVIICAISIPAQEQKYEPTFESLEKTDPVPEWFKDAKFGIYFHWGVYSVPAYGNEWYPRTMYMKDTPENKHHIEKYGELSEWTYNNFITGAKDKQGNFVQFAPKLKSEGGNFDPDEWAQLFADAGAQFAGPVAEHHDGFSLWASKANPWNAKDMGPKLDLVKMLSDAIRSKNMRVILSMHHAYNITGYYSAVPETSDPKLQMLFGQQGKGKNEALWLAKHKEIIDSYKPDIIYQDFNLHLISQPILLQFLAYYYNKADEWNKPVVATFKDGLNTKCAVLDYERGGPPDITENYWLTDDAVSSSSWCYTEGIGYYSKKQILHAFIDRISKNGNMLLNISPKPDGSIPQEQKDVLLAMGSWLKKYGEAIYSTRAWERYGEGPTKMGAAHGVMGAPMEGTAKDVRFTRSKDNTTLYAIMLGWEEGEKNIVFHSLSSDRINCTSLKSVELINGETGDYMPLKYEQNAQGLLVNLPDKSFDELAYVLKLNFDNNISSYDNYVELALDFHYYIVPGKNDGDLVLGSDLKLSSKRKESKNQWKLTHIGKGVYKFSNRANNENVIEYNPESNDLVISKFTGKENQQWKIDNAHSGLFRITNKKFPSMMLSMNSDLIEGNNVEVTSKEEGSSSLWKLLEVCELKQEAYKPHSIPGTIEAEDYDAGCPGDAYKDSDEINQGGIYRTGEGVDIDVCSGGGYTLGWTTAGEWLTYTVNVTKPATYQVSFNVATNFDNAKFHLECEGENITGIVSVPNTQGFQTWEVVKKNIKLEAGQQILKLVIDNGPLNLDKMIFERN